MFGKEPVLIIGAIQSVVILLVAFGVDISPDQSKAIIGATGAVLALLGAVLARSRVTPVEGKHEAP